MSSAEADCCVKARGVNVRLGVSVEGGIVSRIFAHGQDIASAMSREAVSFAAEHVIVHDMIQWIV